MIHSISDRCADLRSAPTNSRVNLSKAGHCELAGCERHGCRDQAPMDRFTAPPRTHPARPLTVSCARPTAEKNKEKQRRVARCARSVSTKVDTCQSSFVPTTAVTNSRRNLSEVGRCGWAGPLAPWMAPSSPHGWVYGAS
jgi:hypothetical protein